MPPQFENNIPPINNLVQQKSLRKYSRLIPLLAVLVLVCILSLIYFILYKGSLCNLSTIWCEPDISTTTPILGGDKDEHECIGSAGYSWCEVKNKCLRIWEEPCEVANISNWKAYHNEQYGFELKYPGDLNTVKIGASSPLEGYTYRTPTNESFTYNAQSNTWSSIRSPQTNVFVLKETNGIKWFSVDTAEIGILGGAANALIPDSNSKVMVEISVKWGKCAEEPGPCQSSISSEAEARQTLSSILSTFKFLFRL